MPSFDIVSEVDAVELRNAVDNSKRELDTASISAGWNLRWSIKTLW